MSASETWASRDLPLLAAALRRVEEGDFSVGQLEAIRAELGFTPAEILAGIGALESADPPYLEAQLAGGWTDERAGGGYVESVSERARRELGAWPSPDGLVEQLAAALARAADAEVEPERKGRLRAAADALAGVAREVAVRVLTERLGRL